MDEERDDAPGRRGRKDTNIWVIVDLCYEQLIYEPVPHNLPKVLADRMRDRTILCGSASKSYSMTGWRCGWAVGPAQVIAACNALQSHSTSNVVVDLAEGGARGRDWTAGVRRARCSRSTASGATPCMHGSRPIRASSA